MTGKANIWDKPLVREACKMSRSTQCGLSFKAFAVVHSQTLGRLHSIVETSTHQSGAFSIAAWEGCWPLALTSLSELHLLVSTSHSFKKKELTRKRDLSAIDSWTFTNAVDGRSNTKKSLCFRKVPVGSPIYHDYTRMNEEI